MFRREAGQTAVRLAVRQGRRLTCREAGETAVRLARRLENLQIRRPTKLEAHHRHLHYTHQAITNCWLPKSLRFKAPSQHPIFKRIMERASNHCMRARITICHDHKEPEDFYQRNQKQLGLRSPT